MAEAYKVLGQSNPTLATLTDIYTVPGSTSTICSTILVCNRSSSQDIFRISVAVGGAVDSPEQYIYNDLPIAGNDTFAATLGLTISSTDIIRVYSTNGTSSFNITGVEIT